MGRKKRVHCLLIFSGEGRCVLSCYLEYKPLQAFSTKSLIKSYLDYKEYHHTLMILIHGKTKEECHQRLINTLEHSEHYNLHINLKKYEFFKEEITYLGYIIKNNTIKKDTRKIEAIRSVITEKRK